MGGKLWFLYSLFVISAICVILNQISEFLQRDKQRWWIDVLVYIIPYVSLIMIKYLCEENYHWLPVNSIVSFYRYFIIGMMIRKYSKLNGFVSQSQTAYMISVACFVVGVIYANYIKPSMATSALTKIGKHTLAIYVFHYFFLPDLKFFATYINTNHQFILQLALCLAASSVIITLCVFIENLIDRSALLRFVLL